MNKPVAVGARGCAPDAAELRGSPAQKIASILQVGRRQGRTGAEAEGDEGVGRPNKSDEAGKRVAPEPVEQRRACVEKSLWRET